VARVADIDLGPCRAFLHPGSAGQAAIVLPGAGYSIDGPLLWYSRQVLSAAGRTVVAVRDSYGGEVDPREWVEARAKAALDYLAAAEPPLIVAKSISTLAAPLAAEGGMPGVWLTPILSRERPGPSPIVDGLRAARAPLLLVGGTADPAWDGELARSLEGARVLEVEGADHSLGVTDDPSRSLDALRTYVEALTDFVGGL
jgi:hypothetical protein